MHRRFEWRSTRRDKWVREWAKNRDGCVGGGDVVNSPNSRVSIQTFQLNSLHNTRAVRNYVETINEPVI